MISFHRVAATAFHQARRTLTAAARSEKPRPEIEGITPPPLTQFSESENVLAEAVHSFAVNTIKPAVREMDEKAQLEKHIMDGCFENGLMAAEVEEKYGGSGASFFDIVIIVEELAKVDPSVAIFVDVQNTLVVPLIIQYGTEEQKQKYLTRAHTDLLGAFALTEAGSGSDAFAMKTTAKLEGDNYILNGSKMWITNAGQADFFLVFANADPSKGYKGITVFLVDKNLPGVSLGKKEDKLGIRASNTCSIFFDNVPIPKNMVLGEIGKGYKLAMECLNGGRIGIGAQMIGIAQGCYDATIPYLQERKQFNTRIIDFQSIQHQIADIATKIECARLLVYNAARLKQAGLPYVKEAAMCKWFGSVVADNTTSKCIEWMGGIGYTKECPVEKFYRDCKIGSIYEGTSNIHLNTIGKLIDQEYLKR